MATLYDAHEAYEKEMQGLESQVPLDAMAITHLAMLWNDISSNYLCVTSANVEFQRRVNTVKGTTLKAVSSA